MNQASFYETKQFSPTGLAIIVALHGAAITAAMLAKMEVIPIGPKPGSTEVKWVKMPKDPPEVADRKKDEPRPVRDDVYVPPDLPTKPVVDPVFERTPVETPFNSGPDDLTDLPPPPPLPPEPLPLSKPVSAKGDVRTLFSPDDYPDSARQQELTGSVQAKLEIGTNGKVTGCSIVKSSGSSVLDRATCRVLQSRARFTPAKDSSGQPISDTVVTPKIVWKMEGRG